MVCLPAVARPLADWVLQPRAEVVDDVVGLRQQVVRQRQVGQEDGGRRALGPGDTRIAFYDILDLGFR